MDRNHRRAAITADIIERTGIDEAMIERLVRAFYAKVREDALLALVFTEHVTDWESHLQRMCAFWSSVALITGRYHGQPTEMHRPLPIDARHFDRWLDLFETTARELCPPRAAEHFVERARNIAQSLELAIASEHGQLLQRGQRLYRPDAEVFLPVPAPNTRHSA